MSWSADSWASSGGSYSDTLFAPSTLQQSYDDYTGRVVFYKTASDESSVPVDLFINSLQYTIAEHMQFEQMQGNMFSYVAFGKDAMRLNLGAFLVDTGKNYGKDTLVDFYRNYLRLEAVARRGACPILVFPNAAFYCAASSLSISETGQSEDVLTVSMSLEITAACFISSEDSFVLDYVHGTEMSKDSVLNTELAVGDTSTAESTSSATTEKTTTTSDVEVVTTTDKEMQNSYTMVQVGALETPSTTGEEIVDVSWAEIG